MSIVDGPPQRSGSVGHRPSWRVPVYWPFPMAICSQLWERLPPPQCLPQCGNEDGQHSPGSLPRILQATMPLKSQGPHIVLVPNLRDRIPVSSTNMLLNLGLTSWTLLNLTYHIYKNKCPSVLLTGQMWGEREQHTHNYLYIQVQ